MNKTFAIIKPDAVEARFTGQIIDIIEKNKISILEMKKLTLTRTQAEQFYAIHKERSWFSELVDFMTSGPIVVMVLSCDNAVISWRNLMGATNPKDAAYGTIRKMFGVDIGKNGTHGSDSDANAEAEIAFFFGK
jgi:nucleoside-diphosphate kinase